MRKFIIISRTSFNLQDGHEYKVEMAMFNVKRSINPKVGKPELRFIGSAHRLIVLNICVKLRENIQRTRVHSRNGYFIYYFQRAAIPKVTRVHLFCVKHVVS